MQGFQSSLNTHTLAGLPSVAARQVPLCKLLLLLELFFDENEKKEKMNDLSHGSGPG